ncbi:unnamed protein product [Agarophyton chilense]
MSCSQTSRRQHASAALAFSPLGASAFVRHGSVRQRDHALTTCCAALVDKVEHASVARTSAARPSVAHTSVRAVTEIARCPSPLMIAALPTTSVPAGRVSRFTPVPPPKPHEILRPRRGRNARRRTKDAESFRRYMYLRRQLKPWSDEFRRKHGRTPGLIDVHASDVPGLLDRFVEFLKPRATLAGWKDTRLTIPSLRIDEQASKTPELPGIHFDNPPNVTAEDILHIVKGDTPDSWVNEIVHTFLGWRKLADGSWNDDLVGPEWKKQYPNGPPDFIGDPNDYSPEVDLPVKLAMQKLVRSIPAEYKQLLKEVLRPLGFRGWKIADLTPNRTRRATAMNWVLYWYRVHYPERKWH